MSDDAIDPDGDGPSIDEVERALRLARAEEVRARVAEREAMRANLPVRVDEPASPAPYVAATAITMVALVAGIAFAGFPAALATQFALSFLALSMIFKRMEDVPSDHPSSVLRWASDRIEALGEKFGVELYGMISLTAFLRAEALSLSSSSISLAEILANPIGGIIQWFVAELIESVMNAVWAALWWMPLFSGAGWQIAAAVIAAAWAVLWVLDMPDRERDGSGEVERLAREVESMGDDVIALGDGVVEAGRDLP